jgi:hypothetical protein
MMSALRADPIEAVEIPFARARAHVAEVEGILTSDEMIRKPHSDLEAMLVGQGMEWARLMLEENLRLRAQLERTTSVVGADGVERESTRDSERHLETLLGRVPVQRLAYQAPGATDLHPMDAALNLPREMFSHGIRRMVAREAATSSFDEVVDRLRELTGASVAKRQVEELAIRAAQDFDAFYEQRAAVRNPKDDLLILSTDGKGIVMRHEDLREGTRRAAEKSGRKLETRLTPGEKSNRKRMAQVATVYSIAPFPRGPGDILHSLRAADEVDAKRPRPTDKRVWASVEKTSRAVIREAFEEALRRDPEKARRWVVLVDGDPKQLRAVKAEARRAGVKVTILADIVHVIEYVWDAARALFGGSCAKAEKWVSDRLLALLTGRSGGELLREADELLGPERRHLPACRIDRTIEPRLVDMRQHDRALPRQRRRDLRVERQHLPARRTVGDHPREQGGCWLSDDADLLVPHAPHDRIRGVAQGQGAFLEQESAHLERPRRVRNGLEQLRAQG